MNEFVTVDRILILINMFGWVVAFLAWLAPRTATTKDDEALAKLQSAKSWALNMAPHFWSVIELLGKTKGLPSGVTKATEFIQAIRSEYQKQHGHELPAQAEAVATTIAKGLSAANKLSNPPQPPAG